MSEKRLLEWASEEVECVLQTLPDELREPMQTCAISYEMREQDAEGNPRLSAFEGRALHEEEGKGEPKIRLFLENLWDFADHEEESFRDQVGATVFHEMGNFMGWEETEEEF